MIAGVVLFNAARNDQMKSAGRIGIGLGLMLLALSLLGEVSDAVRDSQILKLVLSGLGQEPLLWCWWRQGLLGSRIPAWPWCSSSCRLLRVAQSRRS
jgi:Na+/phosphate symporter